MDPRRHPVAFPEILLQRTTRFAGDDTAWKVRFDTGKAQFLLPHEWRLLLYALGKKLLVGEELFTKELETKPDCILTTSAWRVLRVFRESQAAFVRSCACKVPYLASFDAWSCFSAALRALKVDVLSMTPEWSAHAETACVFTDRVSDENRILVFSYTTRDALSGVEGLATSPGFVCSSDFLPIVHSWMVVGHAETFLNEFLYDLLKTAKENRDENTALQLLNTAMQNSRELTDAVRMIDCATFVLYHTNERWRTLNTESGASTPSPGVSVKREAAVS